MKYLRTTMTIVFLLLGTIVFSYAQNSPSALSPDFPAIIPQTPEVTKLMGMINYPVSYNTGTVKTEIPIYEIKLRNGYTLPIKLVYQSSGFKPREHSNVGVGWTLIAEPQIAHAVNGLPDESTYGLYANKGLNFTWSDAEYTYVDAAYGRYDIEPDQYFYMLPHKGGSFFLNRSPIFNDQKEFVTVPYDPIRVEGLSDLKNFRMTDTDGVIYHFIPTEHTNTVDPNAGTSINAITVYKADQIITPSKENITFHYRGLDDSYPYHYTISNSEQSATLDIKSSSLPSSPVFYCNGGENANTDESIAYKGNTHDRKVKLVKRDVNGNDAKVTTYEVLGGSKEKRNDLLEMCDFRSDNVWKQTINYQYVSRIVFPGGTIEFIYTQISAYFTAEEVLTGIVVKNNKGDVVKQFHLISDEIGTRPCLREVQELSDDGVSYRKYTFRYWSTAGESYDGSSTNAWGYGTGKLAQKQACIPKLYARFALFTDEGLVKDSMDFNYEGEDYYEDVKVYGPNLNFMLRSVTYPTGGKTEFTYEDSKFFESLRQKEVATGSVRVKEIKDYQSDGTLSSCRLFKYGQDESGLGIPVRLLKDTDFMTSYLQEANDVSRDSWGLFWTFAYKMYKVDLHARPVVNDFLDASASIVYDQVTEYVDEAGKYGKTVYEYDYSNLDDVQSQRIIEPYQLQPIMHKESYKKYREWSIGQLVRKTVYDGKGTLLREEKNTYIEKSGGRVNRMMIYPRLTYYYRDPFIRSWETIRDLKAGKSPNPVDNNSFPNGIKENYQYDGRLSFGSGCKLLRSTVVTDYENEKVFSDTVRYLYNEYLLPVEVERTMNNGKKNKETFSYPVDFDDGVSSTMVARNMLSPVVRHMTTSGDATYDIYSPYRLSSDIPVIDRLETGKGNGKREVRIRFVRYDSFGNLLEAIKDNDQRVAYIRGYNSLYPVAKLEGAGYDYFPEEMGQMENYSDSTMLERKCADLRNSLQGIGMVTSYTYRPLVGITSVVQPNGDKTSYHYGKFGDLISEINADGKKEKQYVYNYKYNGNQSPLTVSFSAQGSYYVGNNSFTASARGGTGGYRYQWFLTDGKSINYQTQVSTSSMFSFNLTQIGNYRLTCRVTDASGNSSSSIASFEVKLNLVIKFEHIHYFTDRGENFVEADINCPIETNISFRLAYDTDIAKGITFYINNKEFKRTGSGSDVVTVKCPKGNSRVYTVIGSSTKSYFIGMEAADAGVTFEYPYVIVKQ